MRIHASFDKVIQDVEIGTKNANFDSRRRLADLTEAVLCLAGLKF